MWTPALVRPLDAHERSGLFLALDATLLSVCLASMLPHTSVTALALTVALAASLLALALSDLYVTTRSWSRWQLAYVCFKAIGGVGVLVTLGACLAPLDLGAPTTWASGFSLGALALVAWRLLGFRLVTGPARHVVIVGDSAGARKLYADLEREGTGRFRVLGFVDGPASVPSLGGSARLSELTTALPVDALVLASGDRANHAGVVDCLERGLPVLSLPSMYERLTANIPLICLEPSWFIYELREGTPRAYLIAKRFLDVVVATIGLVGTSLLLPALALAIKLGGGPGPILYSQLRVGYRGRLFRIYKFRTMRQDAERGGAVWAAAKDARVTPVGRFLRHSRLDELPQFFNVLRGDMSIVGPRPERPEFVDLLAEELPFYQRRHLVAPGVTGWAQVMFPYGASVEDAREKLQYDLYYLKNRSLYLDLKVMFKTIRVMASKFGAR
ncbi:MAG TPA: sugar transferase [Oscillatoriaceae cyanobacterium]